jgi:hypothetical protein
MGDSVDFSKFSECASDSVDFSQFSECASDSIEVDTYCTKAKPSLVSSSVQADLVCRFLLIKNPCFLVLVRDARKEYWNFVDGKWFKETRTIDDILHGLKHIGKECVEFFRKENVDENILEAILKSLNDGIFRGNVETVFSQAIKLRGRDFKSVIYEEK